VAKLAKKEKEKEKEKEKAKGKNKVNNGGQVGASDTIDQGSMMQGKSEGGVKRKANLLVLTEAVITHGTHVIVLGDEDVIRTKDLILNISIDDLVEDIEADEPSWYIEVGLFKEGKFLWSIIA